LSDVARAAGVIDLESEAAYAATIDFFVLNKGEIAIITHYGNDATMERFFRRPTMAICTDGLMPGPGQKPHPRSLGSFPKALRMAREMGIPLVEMVWRMATLPCHFLNPEIRPEGIDRVWIHGILVLDRGRLIAPRPFPGRALVSPVGAL